MELLLARYTDLHGIMLDIMALNAQIKKLINTLAPIDDSYKSN